MAKVKTTYFCQSCGAQSPKWLGKCPSCGEWNTYVEEIIQKEEKGTWQTSISQKISFKPKSSKVMSYSEESRIKTEDG